MPRSINNRTVRFETKQRRDLHPVKLRGASRFSRFPERKRKKKGKTLRPTMMVVNPISGVVVDGYVEAFEGHARLVISCGVS